MAHVRKTLQHQSCLPLILPKSEEKIGIFIQECEPDEKLKPLTKQEMQECVLPIHKKIETKGWTITGFEAGRGYDTISYMCDCSDFLGLCDWNNWIFDCENPPTKDYKKWAIEFPVFKPKYHFVRRYFFFQSHKHVPKPSLQTEKIKERILQNKKYRARKNKTKPLI